MVLRKAYHRLILPDGQNVGPAVVLLDEQGKLLSWHKLEEEEPFTEWMGGEYKIYNYNIKDE